MKEAYFYQKLENNSVQCETCNHFCLIAEGKQGICGARENKNGKLFSLVYGLAIAENIDPIEKKPLYHFMAGTNTLTIATEGCNFHCAWCQNYDISQGVKKNHQPRGFNLPPAIVVKHALKFNCPSISYSYTEPTIFLEYALETMKLAKKFKIKNIWVSNGYMSEKTREAIAPYLDAINIDLKTFNEKKMLKYSGAKLKPILENIKYFFQKKIHLELTTLVVPGVNDDEKQLKQIAGFIKKISPEIPYHLSRYYPAYKMKTAATAIETLEKAAVIAKKVGLKNVYIGNI